VAARCLKGTYAYTWNAADQLTAVAAKDNSVKATFQWDGEGRCIEKDVYTSNDGEDDGAVAWALSYTRKFVYDGTQLVEELDGNGNPVTGYTWGPQGLMAVTDYTTAQSTSNPNGTGPTTYLAELDGQGNVVGLVNASSGGTEKGIRTYITSFSWDGYPIREDDLGSPHTSTEIAFHEHDERRFDYYSNAESLDRNGVSNGRYWAEQCALSDGLSKGPCSIHLCAAG